MCAGMRWAGRFSAFSIAQTRPVRKRCGARPAITRAIRFAAPRRGRPAAASGKTSPPSEVHHGSDRNPYSVSNDSTPSSTHTV